MTNPIAHIRKEHALTQQALASIAGVTSQVVMKVEQGVYPTLPPSIVKAIEYLSPELNASYLHSSYARWIENELHKVKIPSMNFESPVGFKGWMEVVCAMNNVPVSVNSFCTLFKIHPYVIQKYVSGKMKNTPVQLLERIAFIRGDFNGNT